MIRDRETAAVVRWDPITWFQSTSFFLDATEDKRDGSIVMRKLAIALIAPVLVLASACGEDPEEPNAFQTQGNTSADEADATVPDMMAETGSDDVGTTTDTTTDTSTDTGTTTTTTTTTTTGGAVCGNGTIDDGEQCDGGNLNGYTCADLGYSGGTLACDPVTCTYDASGCVTDPDGGGSGTSG